MAKPAQTPAPAANPLASTSSSAPPQPGTTGPPTQASSSVSPPVPSQSPNAAPNTQSSSPTSNIPASSPTSSPQPPSPQIVFVPAAPAIAPVQVLKKTEWTTVTVALTTVVLTAAALAAAYVMIPHALETQRNEFHARCLADYDHGLPMAKGCPKELNGPRLSFVKRQIETAHVIRFAAAQGIQFAKMRLEGSPDLRIFWHGVTYGAISAITLLSIWFLILMMKPDLMYSRQAVVFLLVILPISLFLVLWVWFLVDDERKEIFRTLSAEKYILEIVTVEHRCEGPSKKGAEFYNV
jgi:hypothetical protein